MPIQCLTAGRMTMSATVLHQNQDYAPAVEGDIDLEQYGTWVRSQDPLTHEIVRVWKPTVIPSYPEGGTGGGGAVTVYDTIPCIARGIVDGGIRVAGTTERFGDSYENIDFVKMWIPSNIIVSKRDRITNIRDPRGRIIWVDEEFSDPAVDETPRATVFDVNGVTPLFNAFNRHTESFVLLQRSTTRGEGAP